MILDREGKERSVIKTDEQVTISIEYEIKNLVEDAVIGIGFFRSDGVQCYGTNTRIDKMPEFELVRDGVAEVKISSLNLIPGQYLLDVAIESQIGIAVDYFREAYRFEVFSDISDVGVARIAHQWNISNE